MIYDLTRYKRITVEPLTGSIGAEISGVDVTRLDDETFAEIRRAFLQHVAIFFRDQTLDPASLSTFAERFAPLTKVPQAQPKEGDGLVVRFNRKADVPRTERNLGDRWHADQSSRELPNMAVALYCTECPPYGGDTLFANLCLAYEYLSPPMQKLCEGLIGLHSPSGVYGPDGQGGIGNTKPFLHKGADNTYSDTYSALGEDALALIRKRVEHPIVCTHPETGRPILYMTGDYMVGIKGMTDLESRPLLEWLNHHVTRPELTCRYRWKRGSLAVWDNRCAQHYAINDYEGFQRSMLRIEMEGTRPFGPARPREAVATRSPVAANAV